MPLTFTITLARFSAGPTSKHADKAERSAICVWHFFGRVMVSNLSCYCFGAQAHAQNLPLRKAGVLLLLACTVGVARAAMDIVNDAMIAKSREYFFATLYSFCRSVLTGTFALAVIWPQRIKPIRTDCQNRLEPLVSERKRAYEICNSYSCSWWTTRL